MSGFKKVAKMSPPPRGDALADCIAFIAERIERTGDVVADLTRAVAGDATRLKQLARLQQLVSEASKRSENAWCPACGRPYALGSPCDFCGRCS